MNSVHSIRIAFCSTILLVCHLLFPFDLSFAERSSAGSGKVATEVKMDEVQQELEWTNKKFEMIQAVKPEQAAAAFDVQVTDIEKRLLDLGALKSSYERLLVSITALDKLEEDRRTIEERYQSYQAEDMAERPPYTLTFLDSVYEELSVAERNQKNIHLTVEMLRGEVSEQTEELKILEREVRKGEEGLAGAVGNRKKHAQWKVDEDAIQLRYLQTIVQAKKNEIQRYELEKELAVLQI